VGSWTYWCAVGAGSAVGAWVRWLLAIAFNPLFPNLPLGTLIANGAGGLMIGLALEFFAGSTTVPPEVKLLVVTGFLGGLTTFSTFSAEAVGLIARQQFGWACIHVISHLLISLALTGAGIWIVRLARA
jgi:fluoride exporter